MWKLLGNTATSCRHGHCRDSTSGYGCIARVLRFSDLRCLDLQQESEQEGRDPETHRQPSESLISSLVGQPSRGEPAHNAGQLGGPTLKALAAARALIDVDALDAEAVARKAMGIAADICIYTNKNIVLESLDAT